MTKKIKMKCEQNQNKKNNLELKNKTNIINESARKEIPPKNMEIKEELEDKKLEDKKSLINNDKKFTKINGTKNEEKKNIPKTEEINNKKILLKVDNFNNKGEVKVSNDIKIINQNEIKKRIKLKFLK